MCWSRLVQLRKVHGVCLTEIDCGGSLYATVTRADSVPPESLWLDIDQHTPKEPHVSLMGTVT